MTLKYKYLQLNLQLNIFKSNTIFLFLSKHANTEFLYLYLIPSKVLISDGKIKINFV